MKISILTQVTRSTMKTHIVNRKRCIERKVDDRISMFYKAQQGLRTNQQGVDITQGQGFNDILAIISSNFSFKSLSDIAQEIVNFWSS